MQFRLLNFLLYFLLSHSDEGLVGMFWLIILLNNQSGLELKEQFTPYQGLTPHTFPF